MEGMTMREDNTDPSEPNQEEPKPRLKARCIGLVISAFAAAIVLLPFVMPAAFAESPRTEVPIKQTVLPDGQLRYSITLTVGGAVVEALLDSGSVGLRLLPGAVPASAVIKGKKDDTYGYASGVQLIGPFAKATVAIGELPTDKPIYVQAVEQIGCLDRQPDCPSSRVSNEDFRIGANGFSGQGFQAIVGTGLRPAGVVNPLANMGDGVWIINLPRPGESAPGALIINPSTEERLGYKLYPLPRKKAATPVGRVNGWEDSIPACLVEIDGKHSVCNVAILDTGAPGFTIFSNKSADLVSWAAGTRAAIAFKGEGKSLLSVSFLVLREPGARITMKKPGKGQPVGIRAGTLPYYAFSVLYDSRTGKIGLKPREPN